MIRILCKAAVGGIVLLFKRLTLMVAMCGQWALEEGVLCRGPESGPD